jgi:hypothetical protein
LSEDFMPTIDSDPNRQDPDLDRLIGLWPQLSATAKKMVLAVARAGASDPETRGCTQARGRRRLSEFEFVSFSKKV